MATTATATIFAIFGVFFDNLHIKFLNELFVVRRSFEAILH